MHSAIYETLFGVVVSRDLCSIREGGCQSVYHDDLGICAHYYMCNCFGVEGGVAMAYIYF